MEKTKLELFKELIAELTENKKAYEAIKEPARKAYEAIEGPAWKAYKAIKEPAWKVYKDIEEPARKAYEAREIDIISKYKKLIKDVKE